MIHGGNQRTLGRVVLTASICRTYIMPHRRALSALSTFQYKVIFRDEANYTQDHRPHHHHHHHQQQQH